MGGNENFGNCIKNKLSQIMNIGLYIKQFIKVLVKGYGYILIIISPILALYYLFFTEIEFSRIVAVIIVIILIGFILTKSDEIEIIEFFSAKIKMKIAKAEEEKEKIVAISREIEKLKTEAELTKKEIDQLKDEASNIIENQVFSRRI